jgi:hypothetical protein
MSAERPSLEAQAARWHELNTSGHAHYLRRQVDNLVSTARQLGLRIEVTQASHACSMGATHEIVTVTPSREGYQSTT